MTNGPRSEITRLLLDFQAEGQVDAIASDRLLDLVYAELRRTASALMARERVNHTLQPTALVHEAYMRLVHQDQVAWTDRAHFLGIAARSIEDSLDLGWELLSVIPPAELTRLSKDMIAEFLNPLAADGSPSPYLQDTKAD